MQTATAGVLHRQPNRISRRIDAIFGRILRAIDASDDQTRLHAMSDHMLKDIGLTRDGIGEALRAAAEGRRPS
jgi:uncharacterized protein YjiS (DUF1127 family)